MAAPLGNHNAANAHCWREAIKRALNKRSSVAKVEALDDLAEKLLQKAEAGEVSALRELGDRLDGKPAQTLVHQGDVDNPVQSKLTIELIRATDPDLGTP